MTRIIVVKDFSRFNRKFLARGEPSGRPCGMAEYLSRNYKGGGSVNPPRSKLRPLGFRKRDSGSLAS